MRFRHVDHLHDSRLRLVFSDIVVSFRLATNATLEDIARTLDDFPTWRQGDPLAIDITLNHPSILRSRSAAFGVHVGASAALRRFPPVRSLIDA